MKKILLFLGILTCWFSLNGQQTFTVTSSPPLSATTTTSTGSGISLNIHAYNSINILEFNNTVSTAATGYEIWYNTDSVNGPPNISAGAGWVLHETGPVTGMGAGTPIVLVNPLNIPVGETYGIFYRLLGASVQYASNPSPSSFMDANMRFSVGSNVGYAGLPPTPTITPRGFAGSITYELDMRATHDAGVVSTNSVPAVCPGSFPVAVTIQNFGINRIDSVEVHWEMNGVPQPTVMHRTQLDTLGGSGSATALVTLGNYNFVPNTTYDLKAWTSQPNSATDTVNGNDTLDAQLTLGAPTGLTVNNLSSQSGDVSWTPIASTTFGIIYGPQGFNPATGGTTVFPATSPTTISGLSPVTPYDVYVYADCGGGVTSALGGPVNFSTLIQGPQGVTCTSAPGPINIFVDDFEQQIGWTGDIGTGASNGLWNYRSGGTSSTGTGPTGAHSGSQYVYFEASSAGPASFISPPIDLTSAVDAAELSFWMHAYGANMGYLRVMVSTTSATGPFTDTVFNYTTGQLQTAGADPWQQVGVDLSAFLGQTVWLEFEANRITTFTSDIAIDLLQVTTCGNICVPPSSLTLDSVTETSAYLDWTENGSATQWDIEFGTAGFTPTGTPTHPGVITRPLLVTGLNPASSYDFYVRAACGGVSGNSGWMGPFNFGTLIQGPQGVTCVPSTDTSTVILTEEFDSQGGWTGSIGTGSTNGMWNFGTSGSLNTGPNAAHSGSNYIYYESGGAGPANLISPAINLIYAVDGAELAFWMHAYGASVGYLNVSISTTSAQGPFTDTVFHYNGQLQAAGSDPWQHVGVNLDNYLGQTIWLNFEADRISTFTGDIALDLLTVEACGTFCLPEIYSINSLVAGIDTAVLDIDGSSDNFQIEWGPCGYTQGTGTFLSGTSPFVLTGLTPNTCYDLYVRRNCGTTGFSGWGGPFSVKTQCGPDPLPAPFLETFDGPSWVASGTNVDNEIDVCWNANPDMSQGTEPFKWIPRSTQPTSLNGPLNDLTGGNFMYVETSSSAANDIAYLTTPSIDVSTLTAPALYFWQHRFSGGNIADMEVEVSNDNGATWTMVYSISGDLQTSAGDPWTDEIINLPNFVGDTIRVRFKQIGNGCCGDAAIDSVAIAEAPTCPRPESLVAFDESDSSVSLTWLGPLSANSYEVWYGPQGFYQGPSTTGGTRVIVTNDTLHLTGLIPSTAYDFVVRAICGPADSSTWAGTHSFTTLACKLEESCVFTADLFDTFGDGWNGAEISFYQKDGIVATIGSDFTTGASFPGVPVILCDSTPTYVVVTNLGIFPTEIGFDIHSPYPVLVASHTAGSISLGDTLASFVVSCVLPTCLWPEALTASDLGPDSAVLSWSPGNTGSMGYEVSFGAGISSPTAGVVTQVTDTTYTARGLTQGVNYCYFVREICSSTDTSIWEGPFCWTAPCATFTAPVIEDLESFTIGFFNGMENCWNVVSNNPGTTPSGGFSWEIRNTIQTTSTNTGPDRDNTLAPAMGGKWFHADNSGGTTGDSTMLISPPIDISGLSNPELEYYFHIYATGTAFLEHMYVDIHDGMTWHNKVHELNTIYHSSSSDPYNDTIIDLVPYSSNGTIMVRFRSKIVGSAGGSGDIAIDDIRISDPITCPAPTDFEVSASTMDSVSLVWDTTGLVTSQVYEIEYGPSGFTPGSGTLVTTSDDFISIPATTFNLCQDVYLRANCGPNDSSLLVGPISACPSPVPCDSLEQYAPGLISGQSALIIPWDGAGGDASITTAQAQSGTQSLHIHDAGPSAVSDVVAVMDSAYNIGRHNASFSFYIPSGDGGYYNLLHEYAGATSVWAIEVYLDAAGTAQVDMGTNATGTIGTYNFNLGAWNTVEHIIDLQADTAWIIVNGVDVNVGWQWSLGSSNKGDQFHAINFFSAANAGQTPNVYFDDICVSAYTPFAIDAELSAIDAGQICGDSAMPVYAWIRNLGGNTLTTASVTVNVSGDVTATLTGTYNGSLATLESDSVYLGTINTYWGATSISFDGLLSLTGDGDPSNDSASVGPLGFIPYEPQVYSGDTVCMSGSSVKLRAVTWNGASYAWYQNMSDTVPFATGDSVNVPVSGPSTYYVGYNASTADSLTTTFAGGNNQSGNMFNIKALSPLDIQGFTVNPLGAGAITIEVYHKTGSYIGNEGNAAAWTLVASVPINPAAAGPAYVALPTPLMLPGGGSDHAFYITSTTANLSYTNGSTEGALYASNADIEFYEGKGVAYPFGGTFSPRVWNGRIHYGSGGEKCSGFKSPVTFTIGADTNATASFTTTGSLGSWSFDASASTDADLYIWNFGDNTTGTGMNTSHNYGQNGSYLVTLTVQDTTGCPSISIDTMTIVVTGLTCNAPTNVTAVSTGCDNLEIAWSSNSGNSFIEYGPTGFTPGQGTFSGMVTSTHIFTGLTPGTAYDIYVADVCTSGDTSNYAGPLTVETDTVPKPMAAFSLLIDSVSGSTHHFVFDASTTTGATSYSWDFGNGTSGSGVQSVGSYSTGGSYTVILTASNSCGIDTAMFVVNTDIGLGENALGRSLSVYPNPTHSDVTVEFDLQGSSEAVLRLMDVRGREIIRSEYDNLNGRFREELSLKGLAKGIYMIEIRSGDMRAYRRLNLQ